MFLTATLFSLHAFEHTLNLQEWGIGRKPIPTSLLLSTIWVSPTLLTAMSITGWSARLALVAVGISVLLGFATSAYKRENWELRRSLGELVKGRIHGQVPKPPGTDGEELYKDESHPDSAGSENKPQMENFRMFPLLLFWRSLYSVYVDIAHILRDIVPGSRRNISLPYPVHPFGFHRCSSGLSQST